MRRDCLPARVARDWRRRGARTSGRARAWRSREERPPGPISARVASVPGRSEEHTSELQSLMRRSYAVFCLKKNTLQQNTNNTAETTAGLKKKDTQNTSISGNK